jgi:excisionase family DNA binding protein
VTQPDSSAVAEKITPTVATPFNSIPSLPPDELLTIAEVAVYLKLSRRTAWRWCKAGQLPAVKVGHQWRVARSDLENFVRKRGKLML